MIPGPSLVLNFLRNKLKGLKTCHRQSISTPAQSKLFGNIISFSYTLELNCPTSLSLLNLTALTILQLNIQHILLI